MNYFRKTLLLFGTLLFMWNGEITTNQVHAASLPTTSLIIDGKGIQSDATPLLRNNRMYAPIRVIAENTNASVVYEKSTQHIGITRDSDQIDLWIGNSKANMNSKKVTIDSAPFIYNQRTYVPIRFISENLGFQVEWNNQTKIVKVDSGKKPILHTVVSSDSLWNLSNRYGISVNQIKQENSLVSDQLHVGEKIIIPTGKDTPINTTLYTKNSYIVQSGDTLSTIANTYRTSVEEIMKNNPQIGKTLIKDQVLYLPKESAPSTHTLESQLSEKQLLSSNYQFPLHLQTVSDPVINTYGDERTWTVTDKDKGRVHEGIDIMANKGTPVYSVADGEIYRIGWNTYGGWRLNIIDSTGKYRMYYAHLQAFAPNLKVGQRIEAGQLIAFVGNSGYGNIGTEGNFTPHLHFGMYENQNGKATNPYYYLKYWELNNNQ